MGEVDGLQNMVIAIAVAIAGPYAANSVGRRRVFFNGWRIQGQGI